MAKYRLFSLQAGTALHETDNTFAFAVAINRDLFAIKKSGTGTHTTEVHVLSAASNYQNWVLKTGTGLHETDNSFAFAVAINRDLFAIKKSGTGTHTTEVHVLSAASNYQNWVLKTGTGLHETDDTFAFAVAANRDLFAIKKSGTGTHTTEVHVLSAASNYQNWVLQTGTGLHETDDTFAFAIPASPNSFPFLINNRDLFAIKKSSTGTHSTEVHVLAAYSPSVNINVILVGSDQFSATERSEVIAAINRTREIYGTVGLYVDSVQWYGIPIADSNGRENIDSNGEAEALTDEWTVPNNALDVFFVKTYAGSTIGLSRVDGPCDKDSEGMTGSVVAIEGSNAITALVTAHEACHYLGPNHVNDSTNLMNPSVPNGGNLTSAQGNDMKDHCFVD